MDDPNDDYNKLQQPFDLNTIILQNKIGSGAFGKVYKVKDRQTRQIYAAKISINELENDQGKPNDDILNLSREVNIISKLNHPSILKFIGFSPINFKNKLKPVIITEYASNGTLKYIIDNKEDISDTVKIIIIYGISAAMSYLHLHNIIHRDLKPANILLDDYLFPKIGDFGLSKMKHSIHRISTNSMIEQLKGTPLYMSPEIFQKAEYGKASDVYAFGIILYEIMTYEKPFDGLNFFQILDAVCNQKKRPEFKKEIPESYKNLIEKCWSHDPRNRPSFDDILEELRTNRDFITETINEKDFLKYINYINDYKASFDESGNEIIVNNDLSSFKRIHVKQKNTAMPTLIKIDNNPANQRIVPYRDVMQLDEECQIMINEAETNTNNQFLIGKSFIEGIGKFPFNTQFGVQFLKKSLKNGCKESLVYYCKMLIKGELVHRDINKVIKLMKKYLDDKDPNYLLLSGLIYKKLKKHKLIIDTFYELYGSDDIEGTYEFNKYMFQNSSDYEDKVLFMKSFKSAIDNDCIKSMFKYGMILINGENNFPKDKEEGIKYIKMAADKGYAKASYNYGLMLSKGEIVPKNKDESILYFEKAAKQGLVEAMYDYANSIENKDNFQKKLYYFKKASQRGSLDSIYQYGCMLKKTDDKKIEGIQLIKIAADNDHIMALLEYGQILRDGYHVPVDNEEGWKYIRKYEEKTNSSVFFF